jgi:hypothetical protein
VCGVRPPNAASQLLIVGSLRATTRAAGHDGMQSVPRGAGGRTGVSKNIGRGTTVNDILSERDCCHWYHLRNLATKRLLFEGVIRSMVRACSSL